jgi:hypothetical protein
MPAFDSNLFIVGVIGGALPDVIRIIKAKYKRRIPGYLKRTTFWLGFVLSLVLGGLAVWLLGAEDGKAALAMGFAAPEVISRLASKPEVVDRGPDQPFDLREWWSI